MGYTHLVGDDDRSVVEQLDGDPGCSTVSDGTPKMM